MKISKFISLLSAIILILLFCGSCKTVDKEYKEALDRREEYIAFLEEKYKDYEEVPYGLDITKKTDLVGICYSTWFTELLRGRDSNPPNITNILAGKEEWGKPYQYYWWAEPEVGYYKSDDKQVIRLHMLQLAEMGADYIIIDNTNVSMSWRESSAWNNYISIPCSAILDTICEMREEGLKTPYVVFWNASGLSRGWNVVNAIYKEFHAQERWKDCFVYWEGKPFMLLTNTPEGEPDYDLTLRMQWGLNTTPDTSVWTFLNVNNPPVYDIDGFIEQTCVCAATQESYMSLQTAHGRNHGIFMYRHWANAFKYRPKAITITWWNEWCAIMLMDSYGNRLFTDNYNAEYSRDIEPMKGGHGDQYYRWTMQYIKAYKNLQPCPVLVEPGYRQQAIDSVY